MKRTRLALAIFAVASPASAQDWTNVGGNARRNGHSPVVEPIKSDLLWSNSDDPAVETHALFVDDERVVTVRQESNPPPGGPFDDPIVAVDLETGASLYESPCFGSIIIPMFSMPFVSSDGAFVYMNDTNGNGAVLHCFADTGSSLDPVWSVPTLMTFEPLHAIGSDGSILSASRTHEVVRYDGITGAELARSAPLDPGGLGLDLAKVAVDRYGTVFVTNGDYSGSPYQGKLWVLTPDLATIHFERNLNDPEDAGPALGPRGTLLVADLDGVGDVVVEDEPMWAAWRDVLARHGCRVRQYQVGRAVGCAHADRDVGAR